METKKTIVFETDEIRVVEKREGGCKPSYILETKSVDAMDQPVWKNIGVIIQCLGPDKYRIYKP